MANFKTTYSREKYYEYEKEVVWKEDPKEYPYLREMKLRTTKIEGIPKNRIRSDKKVFGWTNMVSDTPKIDHNLIVKRVFYLKQSDIGMPEQAEWSGGTPAEAVLPDSIRAGEKSEEHKLKEHGIGKYNID